MNDEVYCASGSRKIDLFLLFWVLPVGYISMTKSARKSKKSPEYQKQGERNGVQYLPSNAVPPSLVTPMPSMPHTIWGSCSKV